MDAITKGERADNDSDERLERSAKSTGERAEESCANNVAALANAVRKRRREKATVIGRTSDQQCSETKAFDGI